MKLVLVNWSPFKKKSLTTKRSFDMNFIFWGFYVFAYFSKIVCLKTENNVFTKKHWKGNFAVGFRSLDPFWTNLVPKRETLGPKRRNSFWQKGHVASRAPLHTSLDLFRHALITCNNFLLGMLQNMTFIDILQKPWHAWNFIC